MTPGFRRTLALRLTNALLALLPPHLRDWGLAIRFELETIADDRDALRFALGSLLSLAPRAFAFHLLMPLTHLVGAEAHPMEATPMTDLPDDLFHRPRLFGLTCGIGAALLGLGYMTMADAPGRYLMVQSLALVLGLALAGIVGRSDRASSGGVMMVLASILLATSLTGAGIEGAHRWVGIGGLFVQISLIVVPSLILAFARSRNSLSTVAMIVTAAALAAQPDRAMAGMLAAGVAVAALHRADRRTVIALAASVTGFAVTLWRADTLPAMPWVDQIYYSAFAIHVLAGLAVMLGTVLLLAPALVGWRRDEANRASYSVFGAVWLSAIVAAALGNYPTPVVGYGGSAVIGYLLSLSFLPKATPSCIGVELPTERRKDEADHHMCIGIAYSH